MDVVVGRSESKHVLKNVQALRALAALLVVLVHMALPDVGIESLMASHDRPWLTPFHYIGLCGVDLFFVISGFIMLVTNWTNFGKRGAAERFVARRAIRIYPPYWLAVLPVLAVLLFAKERFMGSHVGVKTGILESLLLLPNQNKFVLTVGWTLVWEVLFYAVFACLLKLDRKYIGRALGAWFSVQILLYWTLTSSTNFYLHFMSTPLPMEFIFGTAVGLLYVNDWFPAPRFAAAIGVSVAVATWIWVSAGKILLEDPNNIGRILIFGLPAMLLVYGAVALESRGVLVASRALQAIGNASYAIYLWHLSILVVLRQIIARLHPSGAPAHAAIIALTLTIVIVFGLAVYRFFERPLTTYLNGRLPKRLPFRMSETPLGVRIAESVAD